MFVFLKFSKIENVRKYRSRKSNEKAPAPHKKHRHLTKIGFSKSFFGMIKKYFSSGFFCTVWNSCLDSICSSLDTGSCKKSHPTSKFRNPTSDLAPFWWILAILAISKGRIWILDFSLSLLSLSGVG